MLWSMVKINRRKGEDTAKRDIANFFAVLSGIAVLGIVIFFVWAGDGYLQKQYVHQGYFSQSSSYVTTLLKQGGASKEVTELKTTAFYHIVYVYLLCLFSFFMFGFSGWIVIKMAQTKSWVLAALPAFLILFFDTIYLGAISEFLDGFLHILLAPLIIISGLSTNVWYILFILWAIAGGLMAKYVQIRIK